MSIMYGELRRNQEMDSSIGNTQQHYHQSYLPSTSSEMDTMFKLIPFNNGWNNSEPLEEFGDKVVKQEVRESIGAIIENNGYSYGGSQLIYQGLSNGSSTVAGNGFCGSFGLANSMASKNSTQSKMENSYNLIRQKSSPAEFFSDANGLSTLREVDSFKASDVSNEQVIAPTRGLNSNLTTFSSKPPSCLKWMTQIAENGNKIIEENCDQNRHIVNGNGSSKSYMPSFTNELWDNSSFNSTKIDSEDEIMFSTTNGLESQEADFCYQNLGLTHHLSLPSSSTKSTSIEKFLQIHGSVPCKIRAKRGFATHPRSIAERVRRTRISDRIKKLEGLFPKSDKQTSTADMLDSVVEYIKDLQEQVQILAGRREKCKCTKLEPIL